MSARGIIEQTILDREAATERTIQNLRRQVDQLRLELERASDGEAECAGAFAGYVLATERIGQWIADGDNVTVSGSVLADLLADMVDAAGEA
jgi:hypothetical protein